MVLKYFVFVIIRIPCFLFFFFKNFGFFSFLFFPFCSIFSTWEGRTIAIELDFEKGGGGDLTPNMVM